MGTKRKPRSRGVAETYIHIKDVPRDLSVSEVNNYLDKRARNWAITYFGEKVQVDVEVVEGSLKVKLLVGGIILFELISNYGSFRQGIDAIVHDAKAFSDFVIEQFVEHEHLDDDDLYRLERRLGVPGKIQRFLRKLDTVNSADLNAGDLDALTETLRDEFLSIMELLADDADRQMFSDNVGNEEINPPYQPWPDPLPHALPHAIPPGERRRQVAAHGPID